jgi:hypothetical protein
MMLLAYPNLRLVKINDAKYLSYLVKISQIPQLINFYDLTFSTHTELGFDT